MDHEDEQVTFLGLFDEVHDTIHMLRHMAIVYQEKAEDLEMHLARVMRLDIVDIGLMKEIPEPPHGSRDNIIQFPEGGRNYEKPMD